jgi:hypothetical protein
MTDKEMRLSLSVIVAACPTATSARCGGQRNNRLVGGCDFERYATTVAAFIRLAMIRIMLRRLAANASP